MTAFKKPFEWQETAQMIPHDLPTLKMVLTGPPRNTEPNSFSFLKFIYLSSKSERANLTVINYRLKAVVFAHESSTLS